MKPNVFVEQPEFIQDDPRSRRPPSAGYNINPAFMLARHRLLLPPQLLQGKTVLDLGSCNAATGAWCLANGASFYQGVEFHESFVASSRVALEKYYPREKWDVRQSSIESYLESDRAAFDVVVASGVLYGFPDPVSILNSMAGLARALVVENMHPKNFKITEFLSPPLKKAFLLSPDYVRFIENEPFVALGLQGMVVPGDRTTLFKGANPSMGAIKYVLAGAGFKYIDKMNQALKKHIPQVYSPFKRFGLLFVRQEDPESDPFGFISAAGAGFRSNADWGTEE